MAERDREIREINIRPGVGMLSIFRMLITEPGTHSQSRGQLSPKLPAHRAGLRRAEGQSYQLRVVIRVEPEDLGRSRSGTTPPESR